MGSLVAECTEKDNLSLKIQRFFLENFVRIVQEELEIKPN